MGTDVPDRAFRNSIVMLSHEEWAMAVRVAKPNNS